MSLTLEVLKKIVRAVVQTRPVEIGCDECLAELDQFAEKTLANQTIPEVLRRIEEHLEICGECREEFEALLSALRGHHAQQSKTSN